jgi:hypothetical protein
MKHLIILAALAASLAAQDAPKAPTVTVTPVNIGVLRQIGMVGITPYAVDHFQVIVRTFKPSTYAVEVTLAISIGGTVSRVSQIAAVTEYGINGDKRCGAVLDFDVADISRAVVIGEPEVVELVKAVR